MLFTYHADGCTITDEDKNLIEEKLGKLKKFGARVDDESTKFHVELVRGTRHNSPNFGIRVQLTLPGHSIRAETSGKTIADATDAAEGKLKSQIEKLKN